LVEKNRDSCHKNSDMIDRFRRLLAARPFVPFLIVTTGGSRYRVASNEHAAISPQPHRVAIWFDDGGGLTVAALHIASVEKESARAA
jgi:hypothetical protein